MERFVIIVNGFQPRRVLEAYINKIIRPTFNEELDIDFLILFRNGIT